MIRQDNTVPSVNWTEQWPQHQVDYILRISSENGK